MCTGTVAVDEVYEGRYSMVMGTVRAGNRDMLNRKGSNSHSLRRVSVLMGWSWIGPKVGHVPWVTPDSPGMSGLVS